MLGNFVFETERLGIQQDGDFQWRTESSRIDWDGASHSTVSLDASAEWLQIPEFGFSASRTYSRFQTIDSAESEATFAADGTTPAFQMDQESRSWSWDLGEGAANFRVVSATASVTESSPLPAVGVAAVPPESPNVMEMRSATFEFSGVLGELSWTRQFEWSSQGGMLQSSSLEWAMESPLAGFRMEASRQSTWMSLSESSPATAGSLETSWIEQTQTSIVSLDFPQSSPVAPSSPGLLPGSTEFTSTSQRSVATVGPGQLSLQTQRTEVFSQFAGPDTPASWTSQFQTGIDLSLSIA